LNSLQVESVGALRTPPYPLGLRPRSSIFCKDRKAMRAIFIYYSLLTRTGKTRNTNHKCFLGPPFPFLSSTQLKGSGILRIIRPQGIY